MPILWRYALQSYLRIFSLSVSTFITVLIIARFKQIARFTALSGDWLKTGLFIVYQVPSILPIAIPFSALLASFLLFQQLSRSGEMTTLRASGLSIKKIMAPLLFGTGLLVLIHFSICSELAPFCRREAKTLFYQETSQNPLLLLQRQKLVRIKHAYLNMKVKDNETTKDLILIVHNDNHQRLNLLSARKLHMEGEELQGGDLSIISYLPEETGFDSLVIENQSAMSTYAPLLSTALKRSRPRLEVQALSLKMLRIKAEEKGKKGKPARIEIWRRYSLTIATFTLPLLGCAFSIEQGRSYSRKNGFWIFVLSLLVLMGYLLGKELKNHLTLSQLAFFLPHPLAWLSAWLRIRTIERGIL